jgi:hypothetical protein
VTTITYFPCELFDLHACSSDLNVEAYGVITAPGLGECLWQSICTYDRKGQSVLRWLHLIDPGPSSLWLLWPQ